MQRPKSTAGLRHVALFVKNLEDCVEFYRDFLGMEVEWQPDEDNVYLTSGNDNLALHRYLGDEFSLKEQRLDHIGFIMRAPDEVDEWYAFLSEKNVKMKTEPKNHRDEARSFYCVDPSGNTVQMIYHKPIANN